MDEQKALVEELKAKLAELRGGDATIDAARQIIEVKRDLAKAEDDLAVMAEAFADDPEPEADPEPAEEQEAPAEPETPEAPADPEPAADPEDATPVAPELALAASGAASPTANDGEQHPGFTMTAAANLGGVSVGQQLDRDRIRFMLQSTMNSNHPSGGKVRLLEMNRFAEDTPVPSSAKAPIENSRIIAAARKAKQEPLMLTAGACFCGPDQVIPDIEMYGRRGRPVAGIFPTIPINGGFRYLRDLTIDPDSGSVAIWTCDDQDLVDPEDPDTWKQCSELDCFDEIDVVPYMIYGCTTVRRQHQWAHPEQVDAWLDKLMVEYDRVAERQLLDLIEADAANSLVVGNDQMSGHGLMSQLVYALGSLAFSLGYQFRADALAGHTAIVPRGFLEAVVTDELLRGFPSGIRTTAEVRSLISGTYGVTLVERLDESSATAAAAATTVTNLNAGGDIDTTPPYLLPEFWRVHIVKPDQWVHGEGTLVGADWYADDALLRQNKRRYFWENVEVLERTGVEKAYMLDIEGCINGARSDLATPPDCEVS